MNKWIDNWQIKKKYRDKSSKMSSVDRKKKKKRKKEKQNAIQCDKKQKQKHQIPV